MHATCVARAFHKLNVSAPSTVLKPCGFAAGSIDRANYERCLMMFTGNGRHTSG